MRFIDDDGVVIFQQRVGLRLGQQDTVRHQLDGRALGQRIGKADLETHGLAQRRAQFLRDALGRRRGGDAARLRVADQTLLSASQFQANLRQLGRLAGTRLARDDDHLVFSERLGDFRAPARDGQVFRIRDRWQRVAESLFRLARGAGRVTAFAAFLPLARRARGLRPALSRALLLLLFLLFRARRLLPLLAHGRALAALRRHGGRHGSIAAGGHVCNVGKRGRLIAG